MNKDWREFLEHRGLVFTTRDGAPTALSTAPGPGPIDLSHFGVLSFTGPDATTFLQGYLTSDLDELEATGVQYAAYCNLKGRVISDFLVVAVADGLQLVAHQSVIRIVADSLAKYLPFSRSKLADISDTVVLFGRSDASATPSEHLNAETQTDGWVVSLPDGRQWICATLDHATQMWETSADAEVPGDARTWALADIRARIVHCVAPTSEAFLPQSLGLVDRGAVSFTKGCYLGQEIVARAQHRGQVKRVLRAYRWQGRPPEIGENLTAESKKDGGTLVAVASTGVDNGEALVVTHRPIEPSTDLATLVGAEVTFTLE